MNHDTAERRDETVASPAIDPRLLQVLVCPLTRRPLDYDRQNQRLISRDARLSFPIGDGIPIMLVDEAEPFDG